MKTFLLISLCVGLASAGVIGSLEGRSNHFRSEDGVGNYAFGYEESHETGGSARQEKGDAAGNKVGSYSVTDADGRQRLVQYTADENGFRVAISSNEPGLKEGAPAGVAVASLESGLPAIPAPLPSPPVQVQSAPVVGVVTSAAAVSSNKKVAAPVRSSSSRAAAGRSLNYGTEWTNQFVNVQGLANQGYIAGQPQLFYAPAFSGVQAVKEQSVYQSAPVSGSTVQTDVKKTEYVAPIASQGFSFSNQENKVFAAPVANSQVGSGVAGQQQWTSSIVHEAQPVVTEKQFWSQGGRSWKAPVVSEKQSWQSGQTYKAPVAPVVDEKQTWQSTAFYKAAETPVVAATPEKKSWESVSVVKNQEPYYTSLFPGQWVQGAPQYFYSAAPQVQSWVKPETASYVPGQQFYSTQAAAAPGSWVSGSVDNKQGWTSSLSSASVAKAVEAKSESTISGPTSWSSSIVHEIPKEVKQFA